MNNNFFIIVNSNSTVKHFKFEKKESDTPTKFLEWKREQPTSKKEPSQNGQSQHPREALQKRH